MALTKEVMSHKRTFVQYSLADVRHERNALHKSLA